MLVYLLDGQTADNQLLFRSRAAVVSPRIEEPSIFEGVPFLLGGSRVGGGGLYIVISRRAKASAQNQSEAWALLRELRLLSRGLPVRAALERLSARVATDAVVNRQRANLWSLMLIQWATSLAPDDPYLQGRLTLGERLLTEIIPGIDRGTDVDRWQGWSILVRIFGDLREVAPAASFGIGAAFPLVNLAGDEELLDELDLRARNRQQGMEAAVKIFEGEARMFVMALCMLPLTSGVVLIDVAVEAAQALLLFELTLHEAGLVEGPQDEWDLGVTIAGIQVFIPAMRVLPFIGRGVVVAEILMFVFGLLALLINLLDQTLNGLTRMLEAIEAGFHSYAEFDTEEFFEIPLLEEAT